MKTFLTTTAGKILIFAIALVIVAAAVFIFIPKEENYRSIVAREINGNALISNDDKKNVSIYEGMALFGGDSVAVDENSYLTIELDGDKHMLAEENTKFTLESSGSKGNEKTVIKLSEGSVLTRINSKLNKDQSYVIETPSSTISVRGTVYRINVLKDENGDVYVVHEVFDGTIAVTPINGKGEAVGDTEIIEQGMRADIVGNNESAVFVTDEEGNIKQEINYEDLPETIINQLLEYINDGQNLSIDKENLEELLVQEDVVQSFAEEWTTSVSGHWHESSTSANGQKDFSAHSYDDGVVTKEATEEEEGVRSYTCSVCGYINNESINRLAHVHTFANDWSFGVNGHWHAASCGHNDEMSAFEAHTYDNGIVTKEATEKEEGVRSYTCTVCGYTNNEVINRLAHVHTFANDWSFGVNGHWHAATCGHSDEMSDFETHIYDSGIVTKAADDKVEGEITYTCTVCGYEKKEAIAKLEHHHTFDTDWTSDASGHWHVATCGHDNEKADIAPHSFDAGIVTKEPTEEEEGEITYTCTVCKYEKKEAIANLEHRHTFDTDWTSDASGHWHAATCGHDNEKADIAPHSFDAGIVTKEPTEEEEGEKTYTCTVCKYEKKEAIARLEHHHKYSDEWSSDETEHWHAATCVHENERADIAPHSFDAGVETKKPTTDEEGEMTYTCTVCEYSKTKILPRVHEHIYADGWEYDDEYHWRQCIFDYCEYIEKEEHWCGDLYDNPPTPTHDQTVFWLAECSTCEYIEEQEVEFTGIQLSGEEFFDYASVDTWGWILDTSTPDFSKIKVLGLYSDYNYEENNYYYRELNPDEYSLKMYYEDRENKEYVEIDQVDTSIATSYIIEAELVNHTKNITYIPEIRFDIIKPLMKDPIFEISFEKNDNYAQNGGIAAKVGFAMDDYVDPNPESQGYPSTYNIYIDDELINESQKVGIESMFEPDSLFDMGIKVQEQYYKGFVDGEFAAEVYVHDDYELFTLEGSSDDDYVLTKIDEPSQVKTWSREITRFFVIKKEYLEGYEEVENISFYQLEYIIKNYNHPDAGRDIYVEISSR